MTDDHEHEGFPVFMMRSMPPSPEEVAMHEMQRQSNGHDLRTFFKSLDEEQLRALVNVINQVNNSSGAMGFVYQGIIAELLEEKFGVCLGCGKKHDEELADVTGQAAQSAVEEPVEPSNEPRKEFPRKGTAHYDSLMNLYGMEQDDDGSDKVMCKNCGMWYQNLEDRTRRPAGVAGCSGCQHKSAWG